VIAAMLLGIVESITATFYGPSWAPAVSFGFLLLTLAFRPAGLVGTLGPCVALLLSRQHPGRRAVLAFARWLGNDYCSSPATPCCNSSCWRPPGTSSAAIAAT
jgi:hypothetical protein